MPDLAKLVVCASNATSQARAQALAQALQVPCCLASETLAAQAQWQLQVAPQGLSLQEQASQAVLRVDFLGGAVAHRRRFGGGRGQPLARAVGLKAGYVPTVVDATAGLGRDAFVLASLGCQVQLLERSPLIAALLEDGLCRAAQDEEIGAWVKARLQLQHTDACLWLQRLSAEQCPEVIYLDPMYPERQKSALVKKEMRFLQALLGADEDSGQLLEIALQQARRRVVVKRPSNAPPLHKRTPTASISSKNTRFDIYPTHLKQQP